MRKLYYNILYLFIKNTFVENMYIIFIILFIILFYITFNLSIGIINTILLISFISLKVLSKKSLTKICYHKKISITNSKIKDDYIIELNFYLEDIATYLIRIDYLTMNIQKLYLYDNMKKYILENNIQPISYRTDKYTELKKLYKIHNRKNKLKNIIG